MRHDAHPEVNWTLSLSPAVLRKQLRRWTAEELWLADALGAALTLASNALFNVSLKWQGLLAAFPFGSALLHLALLCSRRCCLRHRATLLLAFRVIRSLSFACFSLSARANFSEVQSSILRLFFRGGALDANPSAGPKAALVLLLLYPLLAMMESASFAISFKQQLALSTVLLPMDVLGAAPLIGCTITNLGLSHHLSTPCRALELSSAALYGLGRQNVGSAALCTERAAVFLPAFSFAFLGRCVPLLAAWWAELGLLQKFLAATGRQAPPGGHGFWPFSVPPRALLGVQLYAGLGASVYLAMVASGDLVWAPGGGYQRYCAALAAGGA